MQKSQSLLILAIATFFGAVFSHADTANVALNGVPSANAPLYGNANIYKLIDGDKGTVFHGSTGLPDGFAYTLDLGKDYAVTQIIIYPRQDGCCPERLTDFRVSLHSTTAGGDMGPEVWGSDLFADGSNPGSTNGSLVTITLPSPQTGRWIEVRSLKSPVPDYSLQMTEMQVFANVSASEVNRAIGAVATANEAVFFGTDPATLVNGNRFDYVHGGAALTPGFAYTINLGVEVDMSKIIITPRWDGCCPDRLTNYRVSVYKDNAGAIGNKVWRADLHTDQSNIGSDPGAAELITKDLDANATDVFKGQWVKIESLDDPVQSYALQIGEVEVYGTPGAGVSLLLTRDLSDVAVGVGEQATFSIGVNPINGDTNLLSFQWQKNGTNIVGATNAIYMTPAALSSDEGTKYKVVISYPGQPNLTSKEATLRINYAFHADTFANAPLYAGWNINKLVNGDRSDVFHGDVDLPVGFAYKLRLGSPLKFETIDIYPRQDGCCPERLSNFRVSIHKDTNGAIGDAVWSADLFTDGTNPGAAAGTVVHITTNLNSSGTFEGQWIQIVSLDDPVANYSLQMTELEAFGTLLESATKLSIPQFPETVLGAPGRSSSITVVPNLFNGDPANLTYQWKKNGAAITGATNALFSTGLLQDSDATSKYSVVVSYPGIPNVESPQASVFFDYNYARGSTAYSNQPLYAGWSPSRFVNGDLTDVAHGDTGLQPGFAYTINLGDIIALDKIDIYPRQDACCPERLTNFRISIHSDDNGQIGPQVWSADLFTDGSNPGSGAGTLVTVTNGLDPAGVFKGQWIKIESLEDPVPNYSLQMTELAAIGRLVPALRLSIETGQNGPSIVWTDGGLEQVANLGDTWTAVTGAASPFPIPKDQPHRFYRLKK